MFSTSYSTEAGAVSTRDRVGAAIRRASARTGVDFNYLMNQAKVESGFDPNARASTSSATGLFQFIDQTWLGTVKEHGAAHGLGWAADAIRRGSDGRYRVADDSLRRNILDLRKHPETASVMAAEFAADNRAVLEGELGRPVESVDLYLAHFLGAGGASKFLRAHDANPGAPAARLMPEAARANRWVFYDKGGAPRSLAEIRDRFAAKMGDTPALPPRDPQLDEGEFVPLRMVSLNTVEALRARPMPTPETARLAYMMLADLGG